MKFIYSHDIYLINVYLEKIKKEIKRIKIEYIFYTIIITVRSYS